MTEPSAPEPVSCMPDDKSPICIPFILSHLENHLNENTAQNPTSTAKQARPFIIGLNGIQGVGKTTLVKALAETLQDGEGLRTLVCSIDDLYLSHADQLRLAELHPDNKLVQHRGEPGTHDMRLASQLFDALCVGAPTRVPQYDKSAYAGHGDRVPESEWDEVNRPGELPTQIIIFEGWCVGFRAVDEDEVEQRWKAPSRTLQAHKLEHLLFVNEKLRGYDVITDLFDAFIHIDAEDTEYVYEWRIQQEAALRLQKGAGMTDEQILTFVDGYYPAYELFSDGVRRGIFPDQQGRQLRLIVGKDRKVKESIII
jgi:D-glycerate 3-kinase